MMPSDPPKPPVALPPTAPAIPAPAADPPGMRKAALLVISLGPEACAQVMRQLGEEEVHILTREVARVSSVGRDEEKAVLGEFLETVFAQEYINTGGVDYARALLLNAFGQEHGTEILQRTLKAIGGDAKRLDSIQKADPHQLAKFIHNEHPQTIALILSHLVPSQAAALLNALPPELRADIVERLANLTQSSPENIAKVARILDLKLRNLGDFSRQSFGGVRAVAEILNRLDTGISEEVLTNIGQTDNNLAEMIRHLMFVFTDLMALDKRSLQAVVGKVERRTLAMALKGTSQELRKHFMSVLSQRGAEMLQEDIDALGAVRIKDVETAQQQIINAARKLEADGVLSLKGAAAEQYVT